MLDNVRPPSTKIGVYIHLLNYISTKIAPHSAITSNLNNRTNRPNLFQNFINLRFLPPYDAIVSTNKLLPQINTNTYLF